jgi:hypothetical protein
MTPSKTRTHTRSASTSSTSNAANPKHDEMAIGPITINVTQLWNSTHIRYWRTAHGEDFDAAKLGDPTEVLLNVAQACNDAFRYNNAIDAEVCAYPLAGDSPCALITLRPTVEPIDAVQLATFVLTDDEWHWPRSDDEPMQGVNLVVAVAIAVAQQLAPLTNVFSRTYPTPSRLSSTTT